MSDIFSNCLLYIPDTLCIHQIHTATGLCSLGIFEGSSQPPVVNRSHLFSIMPRWRWGSELIGMMAPIY